MHSVEAGCQRGGGLAALVGHDETARQDLFTVLSIGAEHFNWAGEWRLDNPRYIYDEDYERRERAGQTGVIRDGDILLVKDGATVGKAALASPPPAARTVANQHLFILRVNDDCHPRYYYHVLQSAETQQQIQKEIKGVAQKVLTSESLKHILVPAPTLQEQIAISRYIDEINTEIDSLLDAKTQMLSLLDERYQSALSHALRVGTSPAARLRESEEFWRWPHELPEDWEAARLKYFASIRHEPADKNDARNDATPLITPWRIESGIGRLLEPDANPSRALVRGVQHCRAGDVIYASRMLDKRTAFVVQEDCLCSNDFHVITPGDRLDPEYLLLCLLSRSFNEQLAMDAGHWSDTDTDNGSPYQHLDLDYLLRGITSKRFKDRLRAQAAPRRKPENIDNDRLTEALCCARLPIPPTAEQARIVAQCAKRLDERDSLHKLVRQSIILHEEYRYGFIDDAVHGRLDVAARHYAALNDHDRSVYNEEKRVAGSGPAP